MVLSFHRQPLVRVCYLPHRSLRRALPLCYLTALAASFFIDCDCKPCDTATYRIHGVGIHQFCYTCQTTRHFDPNTAWEWVETEVAGHRICQPVSPLQQTGPAGAGKLPFRYFCFDCGDQFLLHPHLLLKRRVQQEYGLRGVAKSHLVEYGPHLPPPLTL